MAESVSIDQLGPGVKKWATEDTLGKVLKELEKLNKVDSGSSGKIKRSAKKGLTAEDMEGLGKATREAKDSLKKNNQETKKSTKYTKDFGNAVKDTTMDVLYGFGSVLITATGTLTGMITKQIDLSVELAQSGVNLKNSVEGSASGLSVFGMSAIEANLSLKELTDISQKYASTLNRYGIQTFSKVSRQVTDNLRELGVTSSEGAELVAEYLDTQRLMGYRQNLTQEQLVRSATQSITELRKWSKTLGESRSDLQKSTNEALRQTTVQSLLSSMGKEGQAVTEAFRSIGMQLGSKETQNMQKQLMDAIANPFIQSTQLYKDLAPMGLADELHELQEAALSGKQGLTNLKLDEFIQNLAESSTQQAKYMQNEAIQELQNQARIQATLRKNVDEEYKAGVEQFAEFKDSLKEFSTFFERIGVSLFNNDEFAESMNKALDIFNDFVSDKKNIEKFRKIIVNFVHGGLSLLETSLPALEKLSEEFSNWVDSISNMKPGEMVENIKNKIASIDIGSTITKGLLLALGGVAVAKMMGAVLGAGINKIIGSIAFGGAAGGKGPGLFGGLLKGIGTGIGGILSGLANGLAAVGKAGPAVIKGAGILTAALGIIIGGMSLVVGGSAAFLGVTLPLLADSLKSFESVNGKNLINVGKGAKNMAEGIYALMRAQGGAAVTSIFTGLKSLFSDSDNIFEIFNNVDTDRIKKVSNSIADLAHSTKQLAEANNSLSRSNRYALGNSYSPTQSLVAYPESQTNNNDEMGSDNITPLVRPNEPSNGNNLEINTFIKEQTSILLEINNGISESNRRLKDIKRIVDDR